MPRFSPRFPPAAAAAFAALALAAALGAGPALAAEPLATVALDSSGLDEETYRRIDGLALERQAVLRLVEESFAVVPAAAGPDVMLRLLPAASGLMLVAEPRGAELVSREIALGDAGQELQLELSQKLVELALEARNRVPPAPPPPPTAPPPIPSRLEVSLSTGASVRAGGLDPDVRLAARRGERLAVLAEAALSPSGASPLAVSEWELSAGAGVRLLQLGSVRLEAGVLVGALLHAWSLDSAYTREPTGFRIDPVVSVPARLAWDLSDWFGLSLRIAGRFSSRGRSHEFLGATLWRRGPAALEAGIGLDFRP